MNKEITDIEKQFEKCSKIFIALGNETRIHIITSILKKAENNPQCKGMRVGEISEIANLSRPAISHHLKELKDAGILNMREEGTKNYYYFDAQTSLVQVSYLLDKAIAFYAQAKQGEKNE